MSQSGYVVEITHVTGLMLSLLFLLSVIVKPKNSELYHDVNKLILIAKNICVFAGILNAVIT